MTLVLEKLTDFVNELSLIRVRLQPEYNSRNKILGPTWFGLLNNHDHIPSQNLLVFILLLDSFLRSFFFSDYWLDSFLPPVNSKFNSSIRILGLKHFVKKKMVLSIGFPSSKKWSPQFQPNSIPKFQSRKLMILFGIKLGCEIIIPRPKFLISHPTQALALTIQFK